MNYQIKKLIVIIISRQLGITKSIVLQKEPIISPERMTPSLNKTPSFMHYSKNIKKAPYLRVFLTFFGYSNSLPKPLA